MEDLNQYVPHVHFELIPIMNLVSNQDYQRSLSRSHISKAAANFDLYQVNPVKVSRRDGINYVFDGQHTIEIIAFRSGSRETPVWCMIYDDLSYQHEADIFANQMKYVRPLSAFEIFSANLEAENNQQLIIRDMICSYGLKIDHNSGPGTVTAIGTVEKLYLKYGYHILDRVLRLIVGTWEGEERSFSANILNAIARIVVAYGDAINDEVFKDRLGTISVKQLTRLAKDRKPGSKGVAEEIICIYNGKKRGGGRLPLAKLNEKEVVVSAKMVAGEEYYEKINEDIFSVIPVISENKTDCGNSPEEDGFPHISGQAMEALALEVDEDFNDL